MLGKYIKGKAYSDLYNINEFTQQVEIVDYIE